MYRAHARHLLPIALMVYPVAALAQLLLTNVLGVLGALLAALVVIITGFLVQAALVKAVEDLRDGQVDLGTLFAPFSALVVTLGYFRLLKAHQAVTGQNPAGG